nr:hypothetical protein [Tanacetum cinerariifolium]
MVNSCLKKLKSHLASFDMVVKERTTVTAITEGTWGFEHTKACFRKVLVITALKEQLNKLKGKTVLTEAVSLNPIDPELLKVDVTPLVPKLRKNRIAHTDYIRHTQEEAATPREIVESEKLLSLLNTSLDFACKYTRRIQELLMILQQTCPSLTDLGTKLVAVTPNNKTKQIRRTKQITKSGKTTVTTPPSAKLDSNIPVLSSTGVTLVSSASGSMSQDNTKKNRIRRTQIKAKKNKIEDHNRTVKSSLNKKSVVDSKATSFVINFVSNVNSDLKCASCNGCLNRPLKFLGTVKFGNDHVAKIMGYGDYQIGNVTISRVYYMEGLGDNLFSASKTKSWLWHRRLSHLNFGAINHLARQGLARGLSKLKFEKDHLCLACAMGKSTKKTHKPKSEDTNQGKLYLLHMDLCGPMRVKSINGKKYILIIVDDYSRFTWVIFLRSKDETPDFIIKFLKMIQVRLNVPVRCIQTDNGIEFVNQTLRDYYEEVGISHETSVARSSQQNGVVERRNRTLIEAAHTMLIYAQAPLFLWAVAVATACFTQNRSIIRLQHGKTPYELLHSKLLDLSFFYVFGALCYPTNDSENLGKLQPKADIGIFIGYAPTKKAFRIYNRRSRRIVETIHVDFDELTAMASEQSSSRPALNDMTPGLSVQDSCIQLPLQHLMYHLQEMTGICCFNRCSMNYLILLQVLLIKLLK